MTASTLEFTTIEMLAPLLAKKKISPVELTRMYLARAEALDPLLHAFITLTAESALSEARAAEIEISRGKYRGPLHGIPLALKDNFWTCGTRTTAGSTILRDFIPAEDATVVGKLRRAGAVLLGKTNMHEFAYGITGENPHYGATLNPWATERISGGSSSGSAAATAAGLCVAAMGTDTGGSIRVPAALCGVVGLKPTFGRVSCHGVVPLVARFDHVGILARSVHDSEVMLRILAGYDRLDRNSTRHTVHDLSSKSRRRKWRLGWPKEFFWARLNPMVRIVAEAAVQSLLVEGTTLEEVSLPTVGAAVEMANLAGLVEARAFHESAGYFPERAAEYGEDVRGHLVLGGEVRAVDYLAAQTTMSRARAEFDAAFDRVDAIVTPTTPIAAPLIGSKNADTSDGDESVRSALVRLNRPANFTGLPAISVPCGFTPEGLPVGLQLIARTFDEGTLLSIARAYEGAHDWRQARPPLAAREYNPALNDHI